MWKGNKSDPVGEREAIFHELISECKHSVPGGRLSYQLRNRLERYPLEARRDIVNRVKNGCSPLFIACKKGQLEIAEYLVTVCQADIELKCLYEVQEDRSTHVVTPLWCAAVTGKLPIVELLLRHGADINAISDSGSTPVRSACFMTHFDIVRYLVQHGADINKHNQNGGTCLINSVQSAPLCEFLLKHGANVNARDIQNKTALHYAIQEHRLETMKLLLKYGADYTAKSRYGDDALQTACLKGATSIFNHLTMVINYPPESLANAHELMGATFLDEHNDITNALHHWKEGLRIRLQLNLFPKRPEITPHESYQFKKEFVSSEELEAISGDLDEIRMQSLLIAERILGPHHKDTIFRLMYRGASYADLMRYQKCIDLWQRALQIRIEKDSILYTDTCYTAQALVKIMLDFNTKSSLNNTDNVEQRFHDAVQAFVHLTKDIVEMRERVLIRPWCKRQLETFDKIFKCITHLIYLMLETVKTPSDRDIVKELVRDFIKKNVRCVIIDDSILHLCVSKLNTIKSTYFMEDETAVIFPQESVVKLLLECGAPVNVRNERALTPLHINTMPYNYSESITKLLLQYGAHIDQPMPNGNTPCNMISQLSQNSISDIHILNYLSLRCLCAQVICKKNIWYCGQLPKTLESFVKMHESGSFLVASSPKL